MAFVYIMMTEICVYKVMFKCSKLNIYMHYLITYAYIHDNMHMSKTNVCDGVND